MASNIWSEKKREKRREHAFANEKGRQTMKGLCRITKWLFHVLSHVGLSKPKEQNRKKALRQRGPYPPQA